MLTDKIRESRGAKTNATKHWARKAQDKRTRIPQTTNNNHKDRKSISTPDTTSYKEIKWRVYETKIQDSNWTDNGQSARWEHRSETTKTIQYDPSHAVGNMIQIESFYQYRWQRMWIIEREKVISAASQMSLNVRCKAKILKLPPRWSEVRSLPGPCCTSTVYSESCTCTNRVIFKRTTLATFKRTQESSPSWSLNFYIRCIYLYITTSTSTLYINFTFHEVSIEWAIYCSRITILYCITAEKRTRRSGPWFDWCCALPIRTTYRRFEYRVSNRRARITNYDCVIA